MNRSLLADRAAIIDLQNRYDQFVKIDGRWFFKRHTIYNEGNPNRFTAGQPNPLLPR